MFPGPLVQVFREAGAAEKNKIVFPLRFSPIHKPRLSLQVFQDIVSDGIDAPFGFPEKCGALIVIQAQDVNLAFLAPPSSDTVETDALRNSSANAGATDLFERPGDEPVKGRQDLPVQKIIDFPFFDEASVGVHVTEPETEEGILQKIKALFAFFEAPFRNRHLAANDFQIGQNGEILAHHVLVESRFVDDFRGTGLAHGNGPQNGKVVARFPKFLTEDEIRFAIQVGFRRKDASPDIFPKINGGVELKEVGGRAAEDAVPVHERVVGQGREKWPGIGKGERLDQNNTGFPPSRE